MTAPAEFGSGPCGVALHAGPEWVRGGFHVQMGETKPCTHCQKAIGALEVYQWVHRGDGPMCVGLCFACYADLVNGGGTMSDDEQCGHLTVFWPDDECIDTTCTLPAGHEGRHSDGRFSWGPNGED